MAKRLPPLSSLRSFDASSRHLSFTKAAEELFVTQAAVSHQIKALEEFLGVKLFIRKNRSLLLTEEGQVYRTAIRDLFVKLAEATEKVQALGESGGLTVSVLPTFAIQWLVPRLSLFSEAYPDISVKLVAVETEVDFMRDDIDIAITHGTGYYPGLHCDTLLEEYLVPVCSPSLLVGNKPLSEPQDLKYHTLLHDTSTTAWRKWLREARLTDINVTQGPVFSHSSMVLQAAVYGQGIALGHSVLCQPDIEAGRLTPLFNLTIPSEYSYELICPEAWSDRPRIKAFRDWILATAAQEAQHDPFRLTQ